MNDIQVRDLLATVRSRTPARLLAGRAGAAYRTPTLLDLRRDHAAARDAVWAELDMDRDLGDVARHFGLFLVQTQARDKNEYLLRPDRGRRLNSDARETIAARGTSGADLQVVIGDGLSATAVAVQVPPLLPLLKDGSKERGWSFGQPFVIRHCRVGVLNDIGEVLAPDVVVLLIGERPGLATAESLSAYMAYRPRPGATDAKRNLISNIHARGVSHADAARRILALAKQMMQAQASGVTVKEDMQALPTP